MKLSITLPILTLLAAPATASNLFQQLAGSTIGVAVGGEKVPGECPLMHCGDTHGDILKIDKVNLIPNPPIPYVTSSAV